LTFNVETYNMNIYDYNSKTYGSIVTDLDCYEKLVISAVS